MATKDLITTVFPPPTAQEIKSINFLGNHFNKLLVQLQSGEMYLYSLKKVGDVTILEKSIQANSICDIKGGHLTHAITCLQPIFQ